MVDATTRRYYGPWECPLCGADSDEPHRCTECGKLLETTGEGAGRQET